MLSGCCTASRRLLSLTNEARPWTPCRPSLPWGVLWRASSAQSWSKTYHRPCSVFAGHLVPRLRLIGLASCYQCKGGLGEYAVRDPGNAGLGCNDEGPVCLPAVSSLQPRPPPCLLEALRTLSWIWLNSAPLSTPELHSYSPKRSVSVLPIFSF